MTWSTRDDRCGCETCADMMLGTLARRRFLLGMAAVGAAVVAAPAIGRAGDEKAAYKAMLLSCIDPRTQTPVADWMEAPADGSHAIGLEGAYSQFTFAGASVGVIAPAFSTWRDAFWDNLAASIDLHNIRTLLVVDHSNCGAVKIAYGARVYADPAMEMEAHRADAVALHDELKIRHPEMEYQAWLISQDAQGKFSKWVNLVKGPIIG
jgi:carbonic anhydrase